MTFVYFIRAAGVENSPVKIGCSTKPELRKATLETWHPYPLEVAAQIDGDLKLEARFHARFVQHHTHGEWFAWSREIEDTIAAVKAGTFDIAELPGPIDLRWKGRNPRQPWTAEQKAEASCRRKRDNALRAAEQSSGLVCDFPHTEESIAAFIADPLQHGITIEERKRRSSERVAAYYRETIDRDVLSALARTAA